MNIKNAFGKIILKNSISMIKAQPKLLFFPALSTLINFLLLLTIVHPMYKYEISRSLEHVPLYQQTMFYIALLIYFYFRNIVNTWLMDATTTTIYLLRKKNITTPLRNAFKHANHNFLRSFRLITLISFYGFWFRLFQSFLLKFKIYQNFVGKESWGMAILLAPTLLSIEKITVRSALKRSAQLLADTWGHAPLRPNFSLGGQYYKYLLLTIVPTLVSILFQNFWVTYIGIAISTLYYLSFSCLRKTISRLITFGLHHYCAHHQTLPPFNDDIIKKSYYHYEN